MIWEDVLKAEDILKKGNVFFLLEQNCALPNLYFHFGVSDMTSLSGKYL